MKARSIEAVRLLLSAGAIPSHQDEKGDTPLHLAARMGSCGVCQLLLKAGADPGVPNSGGWDCPSGGGALCAPTSACPTPSHDVALAHADAQVQDLLFKALIGPGAFEALTPHEALAAAGPVDPLAALLFDRGSCPERAFLDICEILLL